MKLLTTYIIALTNLYGIAPKKIVLEAYNAQNTEQVTKEALEKEIRDSAETLENHFVVSMEESFVNDSLLMLESDIPELLAEKGDKPYYVPEKTELLRYQDDFYFEKTAAYQAFCTYMEESFPGDEASAREVSEEIYDTIHLEGTITSLFSDLELMGVRLETKAEVLHVYNLALDMFYQTRLWQHNGHTLIEIAQIQNETIENLYPHSLAIGIQEYDETE